MFFGHSLATTGCKSAISASSLALGSTPWSLRREQYGLVTASYSTEFEGSQKSLLRAMRLTSRRRCHCWLRLPLQTSDIGTFRTSGEIRLESAMRHKADIRQRNELMSSPPK